MTTDGMHIHIEHLIQTETINGNQMIESDDTGSAMCAELDDESINKGYRQFAGSIKVMLDSKDDALQHFKNQSESLYDTDANFTIGAATILNE